MGAAVLLVGLCTVDVVQRVTEPPTVSAVAVRERDGERVVVSHNAAGVRADGSLDWPTLLAGVGALLVDGHHPALAVAAARVTRVGARAWL